MAIPSAIVTGLPLAIVLLSGFEGHNHPRSKRGPTSPD
jgi:hypothetical protein